MEGRLARRPKSPICRFDTGRARDLAAQLLRVLTLLLQRLLAVGRGVRSVPHLDGFLTLFSICFFNSASP